MLRLCIGFTTFLLFGLLPFSSLLADLYRWVDDRGVVHFTDNLHNIPERHRASARIIKAKESPPNREPGPVNLSTTDKASIPLQRKGDIVIVQATLNEKASVSFVVDTGASYTMISRATAKDLNIDLEKKLPTVSFQTANGMIQAPLISLMSVEVGGLQIRDLTAAVHDAFPDSSIAGLLGLNFLTHFRMDIDTKNGLLHLEKK